jgi:hypothetical protein
MSVNQLGHINVLYHEASGGQNAARALLMKLGPVVIGDVPLSRRSASSPGRETS